MTRKLTRYYVLRLRLRTDRPIPTNPFVKLPGSGVTSSSRHRESSSAQDPAGTILPTRPLPTEPVAASDRVYPVSMKEIG